eukprot:g13399.t1
MARPSAEEHGTLEPSALRQKEGDEKLAHDMDVLEGKEHSQKYKKAESTMPSMEERDYDKTQELLGKLEAEEGTHLAERSKNELPKKTDKAPGDVAQDAVKAEAGIFSNFGQRRFDAIEAATVESKRRKEAEAELFGRLASERQRAEKGQGETEERSDLQERLARLKAQQAADWDQDEKASVAAQASQAKLEKERKQAKERRKRAGNNRTCEETPVAQACVEEEEGREADEEARRLEEEQKEQERRRVEEEARIEAERQEAERARLEQERKEEERREAEEVEPPQEVAQGQPGRRRRAGFSAMVMQTAPGEARKSSQAVEAELQAVDANQEIPSVEATSNHFDLCVEHLRLQALLQMLAEEDSPQESAPTVTASAVEDHRVTEASAQLCKPCQKRRCRSRPMLFHQWRHFSPCLTHSDARQSSVPAKYQAWAAWVKGPEFSRDDSPFMLENFLEVEPEEGDYDKLQEACVFQMFSDSDRGRFSEGEAGSESTGSNSDDGNKNNVNRMIHAAFERYGKPDMPAKFWHKDEEWLSRCEGRGTRKRAAAHALLVRGTGIFRVNGNEEGNCFRLLAEIERTYERISGFKALPDYTTSSLRSEGVDGVARLVQPALQLRELCFRQIQLATIGFRKDSACWRS